MADKNQYLVRDTRGRVVSRDVFQPTDKAAAEHEAMSLSRTKRGVFSVCAEDSRVSLVSYENGRRIS